MLLCARIVFQVAPASQRRGTEASRRRLFRELIDVVGAPKAQRRHRAHRRRAVEWRSSWACRRPFRGGTNGAGTGSRVPALFIIVGERHKSHFPFKRRVIIRDCLAHAPGGGRPWRSPQQLPELSICREANGTICYPTKRGSKKKGAASETMDDRVAVH